MPIKQKAVQEIGVVQTTNRIERVFVEIRRGTGPMGWFVNVASVDRIIYSILQRFNLEWRNGSLRIFTQAAWHHWRKVRVAGMSRNAIR